ncbi:nuclear transport factor 2 family protein [Pannonibacter carbonis]|uniref:nuclear transport factor 2 family protein n=1 Tax=Pannonibacter carbonis TaxID=2067569 RepID=UPI000D0FE77F|nr:nuclear transport factor 2 family protein [Pannonibacter carbonis]
MRTPYQIIKDHYAASDRGDLEGMVADLAPDAAWTEMDGFPCRGTHVGREAIIREVFMRLGAEFDGYTFRLERLLDAGSSVVGIGDYTGTCKATGKPFHARVTHVWDVENGKVVRFEQFTDTLRVAECMN